MPEVTRKMKKRALLFTLCAVVLIGLVIAGLTAFSASADELPELQNITVDITDDNRTAYVRWDEFPKAVKYRVEDGIWDGTKFEPISTNFSSGIASAGRVATTLSPLYLELGSTSYRPYFQQVITALDNYGEAIARSKVIVKAPWERVIEQPDSFYFSPTGVLTFDPIDHAKSYSVRISSGSFHKTKMNTEPYFDFGDADLREGYKYAVQVTIFPDSDDYCPSRRLHEGAVTYSSSTPLEGTASINKDFSLNYIGFLDYLNKYTDTEFSVRWQIFDHEEWEYKDIPDSLLSFYRGNFPADYFRAVISADGFEGEVKSLSQVFTTPENPMIATDYKKLWKCFTETRKKGTTAYIKLGSDIIFEGSSTMMENTSCNVDIDLCGYTLSVKNNASSEASISHTFISGVGDGSVTVRDSMRYDSAKGEWIRGVIEYDCPSAKNETSVLCGNVTLYGGIIRNKRHTPSYAVHAALGGNGPRNVNLTMYGGEIDADVPISTDLGYYYNCRIYGGTIRTRASDYCVRLINAFSKLEFYDNEVFIGNVKFINESGKERVYAVYEFDAVSHRLGAEERIKRFGGCFSPSAKLYIDGVKQSSVTNGVVVQTNYTTEPLVGPAFLSTLEVRSADTQSSSVISAIEINAAAPQAGAPVSYYAYAPLGSQYEVEATYGSFASGFKNGVRWSENGKVLSPNVDHTFTAGNTYKVEISVVLKNKDACYFADEVTAVFNGKTAAAKWESDTNYIVSYTFTSQKATVDRIDLVLPSTEGGENIPYDVGFSNEGLKTENYNSSTYKYGVEWNHGMDPVFSNSGEVFSPGDIYYLNVRVTLTDVDSYEFAPISQMKVTVNGDSHATVSRISDTVYKVEYTLTSGIEKISFAEVTVPIPYAGQPISYEASVPSVAGYNVEVLTSGRYKNGVCWTHNGKGVDPNGSESFIAGDTYKVTVSLVLSDSDRYVFADIDSFSASVNGNDAGKVIDWNEENYGIEYTFIAQEADTCWVSWYLDVNDTECTAGVEIIRGTVFGEPAVPARVGAYLVGWFTDRELTEPYDPTSPITEDTELFPYWETLTGYLFGDANGDNSITALDIVRLKKYIAAAGKSSVEISDFADANGDETVDALDIVRLKRYFAEYDPVTGKSSVKLGT